ncbi:MAG: hypothetical protein U1E97_09230 [Alphaproteobacteria bacterium]
MDMAPFKRLLRWGIVPALMILAALPVTVSRAQDFFTIVDDLPIMPGLREVAGSGFVFDKPDGRIAEAAARGRVTRNAVLSFYAEALPQLGWTMASPGRFHRDSEGLSLAFSTEGRDLVVRIQVAPLKDR